MKDINIHNLTKKDLVSNDELLKAYKIYLQEELDYSGWEVEMAASDLVNPYEAPFIIQDYEGNVEIDGIEYEVRSCHTDYCYCGLFHLANVKPFEFLMLFVADDVQDSSVGSYSDATKLFVLG